MLSRFFTSVSSKYRVRDIANLRRYRISHNSEELPEQNSDDGTEIDAPDEVAEDAKQRNPIIIAKRKEFNFYQGKTFSKFETIPLASQGWHHSKSVRDYFTIYPIYNEESEKDDEEPNNFEQFGLHNKFIENLKENEIEIPSKVQIMGIHKILSGLNCMLSAETGCGKTLAYLLPIMDQILKWKRLDRLQNRGPNSPLAMIVTPSRELAEQIAREARRLTKDLDIDIKIVTGGKTAKFMRNPSVRNVDVLIGSFGVMSKLITTRIYKLHYVRHVVLDEAHALFHESFEEKLRLFLRKINFDKCDRDDPTNFPTGAQLTLVSATKQTELPKYLNEILDTNALVDVMTDYFHRIMVPQKFLRLAKSDKPMTLLKIVKPKAMKKQPIIIFSDDSATCDWISLFLNEFNIRTVRLNGDMPMMARAGTFASFLRGECTVLSTTNAGARGLDTVDVNDIVNYDFPMETSEYIHRCGRTGRLRTKGDCRVTNLISRTLEIDLTMKIERAARRMRPLPIFNMIEEAAKAKEAAEAIGKKNSKTPKNSGKFTRESRTKFVKRKPKKNSM